jgi:hypothetical protein
MASIYVLPMYPVYSVTSVPGLDPPLSPPARGGEGVVGQPLLGDLQTCTT